MQQVRAGPSREDADVLVGTGMDAVEAKRAVHIAHFARLKQAQFATWDSIPAANAILGPARRTNLVVDDFHFQRRSERLNKIELPDRADVFAERGAAEKAIDDKSQYEVTDGNPSGPPRAVPETER